VNIRIDGERLVIEKRHSKSKANQP